MLRFCVIWLEGIWLNRNDTIDHRRSLDLHNQYHPDLKMTTSYGNLQPPRRLENHEMSHILSLVRYPEIESGDIDRHFQLWCHRTQMFQSIKKCGIWGIRFL